MDVSFVVPLHNSLACTKAMLASLGPTLPAGLAHEIILVDDGSTDGTREWLGAAAAPDWIVAPQAGNLGYAGANNRGVTLARGRLLFLLNNDLVLTPGWIEPLLAALAGPGDRRIVGNIQYSIRGRVPDHAGIFFDAKGDPYHFRPPAATLPTVPLLAVPAATGACLALPRTLFLELGGFDEGYRNGHEDVDLCLRARAAGADILVATRSVIWHHVSASRRGHDREGANAQRFRDRWSGRLDLAGALQPPALPPIPGRVDTFLAATEGVQFYPPRAGGYSEESSETRLYPRGRWTRVNFAVTGPPAGVASTSRIDPAYSPGRLAIAAASVRDRATGGRRWQARGAALAACLRPAGTCRSIPGERVPVFDSTGEDPQWLLELPAGVLSPGRTDILELWIRSEMPPAAPAAPPVPNRRCLPGQREPVHVGVDLTRLQPGGANGGIKVLLLALLRELDLHHAGRLRLDLVVSPELAPELRGILRHSRLLPLPSHAGGPAPAPPGATDWDLLYAPLGFSGFSRPDLPQVSLLVDLLHRDLPGMLPVAEVAFRERTFTESLARSTAVHCISRSVAERLRFFYGVSPAKLLVVHPAPDDRLAPPSAVPAPPPAGRCFIYPANDWPHKNHARLIEAYARYRAGTAEPWTLHLTGAFHNRVALQQQVAEHGLSDLIMVEDYLADADFGALFRRAGALVFPSLHEGFGLPLLEAFSFGVPVACSGTTSLPEVGGDACLYFDPRDTGAIAAAMQRMATDAGLRQRLRDLGLERLGAFRLSAEAGRFTDALTAIAGGRSPS